MDVDVIERMTEPDNYTCWWCPRCHQEIEPEWASGSYYCPECHHEVTLRDAYDRLLLYRVQLAHLAVQQHKALMGVLQGKGARAVREAIAAYEYLERELSNA